jgi:hypothetical protein
VPRGRLVQDDGRTAECRSELVPRYARPRLKALFESWSERDLSEERYAILYALRVASASFARRDLPSMFWFDENQSNELHKPHRGYATIFHGKRGTSSLGAAIDSAEIAVCHGRGRR